LVISNPLIADDIVFYDMHARATLTDDRIGQIVILPLHDGSEQGIEDALMASFHQKTRNTVRKGQKGGFDLGLDNGLEAFRDLHRLHEAGMQAIGGLAKKMEVFEAIHASFEAGRDYQIYQARSDGMTIGVLLVFFYNRTAEYFTPAAHEDFRAQQPLSYLILEAM
jgi:lipid II:glycine glycyltransferase (peptidoglycan interpeptide bridge formation enzyme)